MRRRSVNLTTISRYAHLITNGGVECEPTSTWNWHKFLFHRAHHFGLVYIFSTFGAAHSHCIVWCANIVSLQIDSLLHKYLCFCTGNWIINVTSAFSRHAVDLWWFISVQQWNRMAKFDTDDRMNHALVWGLYWHLSKLVESIWLDRDC